MATYTELYDAAKSNTALSNRITAACQDLANTILQEASPSAPRKAAADAAVLTAVTTQISRRYGAA